MTDEVDAAPGLASLRMGRGVGVPGRREDGVAEPRRDRGRRTAWLASKRPGADKAAQLGVGRRAEDGAWRQRGIFNDSAVIR